MSSNHHRDRQHKAVDYCSRLPSRTEPVTLMEPQLKCAAVVFYALSCSGYAYRHEREWQRKQAVREEGRKEGKFTTPLAAN